VVLEDVPLAAAGTTTRFHAALTIWVGRFARIDDQINVETVTASPFFAAAWTDSIASGLTRHGEDSVVWNFSCQATEEMHGRSAPCVGSLVGLAGSGAATDA
jgi:hypothetical protein